MEHIPKPIHRAYQLEGEEIYTYCIYCKWKSRSVLSITHVPGVDVNMAVKLLTPFERGMLAGAFANHDCDPRAYEDASEGLSTH